MDKGWGKLPILWTPHKIYISEINYWKDDEGVLSGWERCSKNEISFIFIDVSWLLNNVKNLQEIKIVKMLILMRLLLQDFDVAAFSFSVTMRALAILAFSY